MFEKKLYNNKVFNMDDLFEIINYNDYNGRLIYRRNTGKYIIILYLIWWHISALILFIIFYTIIIESIYI